MPIPGTRNTDHLRDNLASTDLQLLDADLAEIDIAFARMLQNALLQIGAVERS